MKLMQSIQINGYSGLWFDLKKLAIGWHEVLVLEENGEWIKQKQ
jgi:hypothetical protein